MDRKKDVSVPKKFLELDSGGVSKKRRPKKKRQMVSKNKTLEAWSEEGMRRVTMVRETSSKNG